MSEIQISDYKGIKIAYRSNTVDENVIHDTINDDLFFKGVPEYVRKDDDVIIDVGAHIGAFSLLAATYVPNGRIYAIEPSVESFQLLQKNIKLNNLTNVEPINFALYTRTGEIMLYHDIDHGNWGHSIVKEFSPKGEMVSCDTLENFFTSKNLSKCDFIKFNCEGAEFGIILSTPLEILKKIDTMLILYHSDLEKNFKLKDLISHLRNADFLIVKRFQYGERGWVIAHRSLLRHFKLSVKHFIKNILKM